ncbi:DUF6493 family protein [Actinacidiphila guanduensis]|uniref:Secreted protein n=1 Tax=Actinacidiphila guanduensis TaxID=310781 RepID=A0A1H0D1A0_9ACTN|nr:DUF6493 family protein [Actinacidiphila guanduensis]SDN63898.1 hypothetical protein SAMN05216259_10528 [Actinacidiphila guanduensis]
MSDTTDTTDVHRIPDGIAEGPRALLDAVREGRVADVPKLLGALTDAERRKALPVLKQWRKDTPDIWRSEGDLGVSRSLLLAGAGCCTGAAAAAQWLLTSRTLWWANQEDPQAVAGVLGDRDPAWLAEVVRRLAERRALGWWEYALVKQLSRIADAEPPMTDGLVLAWERDVPGRGRTTLEQLRENPFLQAAVPRLFEVDEAGSTFQYAWDSDPGWPAALAALAREGRLSRDMLVAGCLSRLLRGGRQGIVKGYLVLLTALELTADERAAHIPTWVRMLCDGHALAAARAQEELAALDAAGGLETEHLVEASRGALFRPEKKIVRAQLAMLDKAVKRDHRLADELLPLAAEVFGSGEHSLQDRALALVLRHRRHAGETVLAELAESAELLPTDLRARAAEAFGGAVADEEPGPSAAEGDVLPPVPEPERLDPAPLAPVELAEEIAVLLRGKGTPAQEERALNSLVVHAHADPAGLRTALEPVVAAHRQPAAWLSQNVFAQALEAVVMFVMGEVTQEQTRTLRVQSGLGALRFRFQEHQCPHTAMWSVFLSRAAEIGARLELGDPLPFLLATPTWATGTIEASELVARLAAYEESGTEPGPADLLQALLRLEREVPPEVRAAADRLTSPAGRRLAAWLASGGLPDPVLSRETERLRLRTPRPGVLVRTEALPGREDHPEPFRSLLGAHDPIEQPCRCGGGGQCSPQTLAVLPQHREIVAARMLSTFADLAEGDHVGQETAVLPALAESGGPAGPATHLLVAYGLGARRFEEQLFAVDAMLVLAARGQLDTQGLGRDIAELCGLGRLKPKRVVAALREAAQTGAYGTVWAVLLGALPGLLASGPASADGTLLALAADCAEQSGARGALPEIDAVAARKGSSQLIKQARRLSATLSREG